MSEVEQNLSTILEIEAEVVNEVIVAEEHPVATVPDDPQPDANRDVEYDYEYTRNLHRDLLEQGQEALPELLKVAKESQHPRAYEVASGFLKNLSDMADKLMILQEKKRALDGGTKGGSGPTTQQTVNIDKAVFTGSTADLLKQIKQQ
jgi:hypothetical protein